MKPTDTPFTPDQESLLCDFAKRAFLLLPPAPRQLRDTVLFLRHLAVSALSSNSGFAPWVPLSKDRIHRDFRSADWKTLSQAGVVLVRPYDKARRKSREFRLSDQHLLALLETGLRTPEEASELVRKRRAPRRSKTRLYDAAKHPWPPLILGALKAMPRSLVDLDAAQAYLHAQREALSAGDERAYARYLQNRRCYEAILRHRPERRGDGLYSYRPAYAVTSTGRIQHVGGGPQNAKRELKAALYGSVPGVRNYDLQSSQACALVQYAREWGVPVPGLETLAFESGAKEAWALEAGVSVDLLKGVLYGLVFGAVLVKPPGLPFHRTALRGHLEAALGPNEDVLRKAYANLYEVMRPVAGEVERWRRHLVRRYVPVHAHKHNVDGGLYLRNAAGMAKRVDAAASRKLAAFLLQGMEAAFVHALTAVLHERGVPVIANEHDGLITLGVVTAADAEMARERSGFHQARLAEKPFAVQHGEASLRTDRGAFPSAKNRFPAPGSRSGDSGAPRPIIA